MITVVTTNLSILDSRPNRGVTSKTARVMFLPKWRYPGTKIGLCQIGGRFQRYHHRQIRRLKTRSNFSYQPIAFTVQNFKIIFFLKLKHNFWKNKTRYLTSFLRILTQKSGQIWENEWAEKSSPTRPWLDSPPVKIFKMCACAQPRENGKINRFGLSKE